ncbi:MAG TPA: hypothetical protein PLV25_01240, partial [Opitutales bacterium]|nr:hypothetical protein [Opitutales bacterium]
SIALNTRIEGYRSPFHSTDAQGDSELLGTGMSHAVHKGSYILGHSGGEPQSMAFKPVEAVVAPAAAHFVELLGLASPRENPRYAERNVATSLLAERLELPVVVTTRHAMHRVEVQEAGQVRVKNQPGIVMEYFEGISFADLRKKHKADYEQLKRDPNFNRDLAALQLLDYLTGQFDRHSENFLVKFERDADGVLHYQGLRGIDNDGCLGSAVIPSCHKRNSQGIEYEDKLNWHGMPTIMDDDMVAAVMNLNESDIESIGHNRLTQTELRAACERLMLLQAALADPYNESIQVIGRADWGGPDPSDSQLELTRDFIYYTVPDSKSSAA